MAWELIKTKISKPADEDLTNDQFRFVVLDATSLKFRRPNAANTDK